MKVLPWILVLVVCAGWAGAELFGPSSAQSIEVSQAVEWEAFSVDGLKRERIRSGKNYLPFLKRSTMSMGLYSLPKGEVDRQSPHDRDEVYYIEYGEAKLDIGDKTIDVKKGSIVFVKADISHKFHTIKKDLDVIVFFAGSKSD